MLQGSAIPESPRRKSEQGSAVPFNPRRNSEVLSGTASISLQHSLKREIKPHQNQKFDVLSRKYEGAPQDDSKSESDRKIEVLSQEVVHLIEALSQENSKLKEEKNLIADDMKKLERISELLWKENEDLTQHSTFRILDLKKIAESISLNLGESENDLRHRIHLYTEQNNSIIRALGDLKKESATLDTALFRCESERTETHRIITDTEFKILESSSRIKDLQNQITSLKSKQAQLLREKSEKTEKLDDCVLDNIDLRTFNRDAVLQLKNQKQQLTSQKPRIITQNVRLHSNIIELTNNQKSLRQQLIGKEKQLDILTNNIERQRDQNQEKQNVIHTNNALILELEDSIRRTQRHIEESQGREKSQEAEIFQLARKKEELVRVLGNADADLKGKEKTWNQNLKQNRQSKLHNLNSSKNNISEKTIAFNHQKATLEYNIKEIKEQIADTNEEIAGLQETINKIKESGETASQFKREIAKLQGQIAQQEWRLGQRRA